LALAATLSHPNIIHAYHDSSSCYTTFRTAPYDADQVDGTWFLVMEYIDGASDLAGLVKETGPPPVALPPGAFLSFTIPSHTLRYASPDWRNGFTHC
jgi:hypothetical protein